MMSKFFYTVIFIGFSLVSCKDNPHKKRNQPNVIIIYADDLGYGDLSGYGGDIPTPNIDKIGQNGIRFTDFYAEPVCTPSRFSLLTGLYPFRSKHHLTGALMPFDTNYLDKSETTISEYLKTKGYGTALIGKWHLGRKDPDKFPPTNHGFDVFDGLLGGCIDYYYHIYGTMGPDWYIDDKSSFEQGYSTNLITDHAINYIEQFKGTSKPFFLQLAYNAPHYGKSIPDSLHAGTIVVHDKDYHGYPVANTLQAPKKYIEKFKEVKDTNRRVYSAMVSSLDDNIGKLISSLDADGMLKNTMIWFISDNGGDKNYGASNGDLRGNKGTLWEGGVRVPAMVFWKNRIKPNQVIHTPASIVDIVPTLGSIIGFKDSLTDKLIDGIDISDILFSGKNIKRVLFWKFRNHSAIRKGDWKLINNNKLYNLRTDKSEKNNLSSKFPEKVEELGSTKKLRCYFVY